MGKSAVDKRTKKAILDLLSTRQDGVLIVQDMGVLRSRVGLRGVSLKVLEQLVSDLADKRQIERRRLPNKGGSTGIPPLQLKLLNGR